MQPFGLLNFIKSVLEKDSTPAPQPSEPSTVSTSQDEPAQPEPTPKHNSFVDFCSAHDARAKRIRKK